MNDMKNYLFIREEQDECNVYMVRAEDSKAAEAVLQAFLNNEWVTECHYRYAINYKCIDTDIILTEDNTVVAITD